jgi:hypothetical protein
MTNREMKSKAGPGGIAGTWGLHGLLKGERNEVYF